MTRRGVPDANSNPATAAGETRSIRGVVLDMAAEREFESGSTRPEIRVVVVGVVPQLLGREQAEEVHLLHPVGAEAFNHRGRVGQEQRARTRREAVALTELRHSGATPGEERFIAALGRRPRVAFDDRDADAVRGQPIAAPSPATLPPMIAT